MSKIKVDDLLLFYRVAEHKNFSKVADQLGIVKSMVSKRISRLEAALNARLINRSTRSMSLTEVGELAYEYASRIFDEYQGLLQSIEATHHLPAGRLKVLAPLSFGSYYLAKITANFIQEFPEISVDTVLKATSQFNLIDSGFDVAIHVGELADSGYMARKVAKRQLSVCASPQYFKEFGVPNDIKDLSNHNCLIHQHLPEANMWKFMENGKTKRIPVKGNYTSNSSHALKHAAINGLGIVMLPDYSIHSEICDGQLVSIFSEYCPYDINIYAVYPFTRHIPPKLRTFLDYLSHELKKD